MWRLLMGLFYLLANGTVLLTCFRPDARRLRKFAVAFVCITVFVVVNAIILRDPLNIHSFIPMGLTFFPTLYFLHKGNFFHKTFFIFTMLTVSGMAGVWGSMLANTYTEYGTEMYDIVSVLITAAILTPYTLAALKYGRRLYDRLFTGGSTRLWAFYSLYPIVALYTNNQAFFPRMSQNYISPQPTPSDISHVMLSIFIVAGFVILVSAILTTQAKTAADEELKFSRRMINSGRSYYENLTATLERVRIMQHDYRHQLAVLSGLAKDGEHREEAIRHLDSMLSHYEETDAESFCANPVADALLGYYAAQIRAAGIDFSAKVNLPEETGVDNYDLCIVLGNLLDNALAAAKAATGERYVKLAIRYKEPQIIIRVANTFAGEVSLDGHGRLVSSREGGGSGSRSINAVVEQYGGAYENEWNDGVFEAFVFLGR